MANRSLFQIFEHDSVIRASANTYGTLRAKGFEVTINPGSEKNRFVGGDDSPLYPDVIVWKPDYVGATKGIATVIEEIETSESVNYDEAVNQWKKFGALGIKFLLIVPSGYEHRAKELINQSVSRVDELWTYQFDRVNNKINFSNTNLI